MNLGTRTTTMAARSARILPPPVGEIKGQKSRQAFTLADLLVVIAVLAILATLPFSALGNARTKSRQLTCLDNLRQMGVANRLYVSDFRVFPSLFTASTGAYTWPTRLLSESSGLRSVFSCPAATPNSWWNTNLNNTLGGASETGSHDAYAVTMNSRFSFGYNGWGLVSSPILGLGGDVGTAPISDSMLVAPNRMIAMGDVIAPTGIVSFDAEINPTASASAPTSGIQCPSNRHNYRTDLLFADGHTETPLRNDIINPTGNSPWRRCWSHDNQPHLEVTWSPNPILTGQLNP